MKKPNCLYNFATLSKTIIGSKIIWIELPTCEIDLSNGCYWLEEAQGDTTNEIVNKTQLKLYFEKFGKRIECLVGMKRRVIKSSENSFEILHNLTFSKTGNLNIKENHPTNFISRLNFKIEKCELWNNKANLIEVYGENTEEMGNILILKDSNESEIIIEAFESNDQENCMKLSIIDSENKTIRLLKKYNWELIENN